MLFQLDIFGQAHPIRERVRPPGWQPSLFTREQEREAERDDLRDILESFRAAGNRGEDELPEVQ